MAEGSARSVNLPAKALATLNHSLSLWLATRLGFILYDGTPTRLQVLTLLPVLVSALKIGRSEEAIHKTTNTPSSCAFEIPW